MKFPTSTPAIFLLFVSACATDNPLVSNSGIEINTTTNAVLSLKDLNEIYIEMQNEDYSCGAASLATLMRHYFNTDINERKVLDTVEEMFTEDEYEVIAESGLSFLELGQVSEALGFQSAAVRLTNEALRQLRGPVLVYAVSYTHLTLPTICSV